MDEIFIKETTEGEKKDGYNMSNTYHRQIIRFKKGDWLFYD